MEADENHRPLLTPLELKVMQVLWKTGPTRVQTVREELRPESNLAYTSVQTVLNILVRKGKVQRALHGRAYQYEAAISHEIVSTAMLDDIIQRVFGGSSDQLILALIENHLAEPKRISELTNQVVFDGERFTLGLRNR